MWCRHLHRNKGENGWKSSKVKRNNSRALFSTWITQLRLLILRLGFVSVIADTFLFLLIPTEHLLASPCITFWETELFWQADLLVCQLSSPWRWDSIGSSFLGQFAAEHENPSYHRAQGSSPHFSCRRWDSSSELLIFPPSGAPWEHKSFLFSGTPPGIGGSPSGCACVCLGASEGTCTLSSDWMWASSQPVWNESCP